VTPSLFEILRCAGWRQEIRPNGKPSLNRGRIEAYLDVNCGDFERDISSLLVHAEMVEGVPLVDLETLAVFKLSYGRDKDVRDLALIERYRERQV
jgi:hypothetical protein